MRLYLPFSFREKNNLTTHKRTHTKEMPYQCDHCSKRFADPSNFNRHRKSHLGIAIAKPCKCKFCGERFSRTANLLRHLVRFHKGEPAVLDDDLEIGMEAEVSSKFKVTVTVSLFLKRCPFMLEFIFWEPQLDYEP